MDRIMKVFCGGKDQKELAKRYTVIERYKGFVLVRVTPGGVKALSRGRLIEDITDHYSVSMGDKVIEGIAGTRTVKRAIKVARIPRRPRPGKHHYLLQFAGPIKPAWLRKLRAMGAEPRAPYQNFTYIVRLDPQTIKKLAALPFVRWITEYPHWARIATALRGKGTSRPSSAVLPRTRILKGVYTVEFFGSEDLAKAVRQFKRLKAKVLGSDLKGRVLMVEAPGSDRRQRMTIDAISRVHGVRSIRERILKRPSNDVAAGIMGTAASMGTSGLGLSGKGEIIGICDTGLDTGDPSTIHPDFTGRVASITSYPITPDLSTYVNNPQGDDGSSDLDSGHGTHVAGSVLGNGSASASIPGQAHPIRGLAFRAKLVFQAVEQEMDWKDPADLQRYGRYLLAGIPANLGQLFAFAYGRGARIHSNSWGGGDPGAYDAQCEQLDRFVWENKDFCIVVAAGNDGTDRDGDGHINRMSVSSPGTAKNCITVGATENKRPAFNAQTYGAWWPNDYPAAPFDTDPIADDPNEVAAFSSRGPTLDNRIKPDVVAPGTFILSTRSRLIASNNTGWDAFPPSQLYFYMGGTSMATPLTAGAVALVRECLRKCVQAKNPSAALLKAALIVGAQRLPGYGVTSYDFDQGFGRVNLDNVLAPQKPASVKFKDNWRGIGTGDAVTQNVIIKSSKAPFRVVLAYSDYPGRSLVNDLNLIVKSPAGRIYPGNAGLGPAGQTPAPDNRNNVEVVHVAKPAAGTWQIQVVGSNVPQGPQDFALVWKAHV